MATPENPDYLSTRGVAEILLVSELHVRKLLRETNEFPNAIRPGRGYLIPRQDVHDYIIRKDKERNHK